jgi:hypothetical protein
VARAKSERETEMLRAYELGPLLAEAQVRTVREYVESLSDEDIAKLRDQPEFKKQNVLLIKKLMSLQDQIRE